MKLLIFIAIFFLPLIVVAQPQDTNYCSHILEDKDEFTEKVFLNSPSINTVSFNKICTPNDTTPYIKLYAKSETLDVEGTTIYVLFTDGTKWSKRAKITPEVDKTDLINYKYRAVCYLEASDILEFKSKIIQKFRVHIFDEDVPLSWGLAYRGYAQCLYR